MTGPLQPADGWQEQAPSAEPAVTSPPPSTAAGAAALPPNFSPTPTTYQSAVQQGPIGQQPEQPVVASVAIPQAYPEIVPPPAEDLDDVEEPVVYALPEEIESAFISMPEDPKLAEQRERTAAILDRAVLVLGVVGLITAGLALVSTVRGNPTLFGWSLPFLFFILAGLCYYLLHRMEAKPPNSVEIPVELADDLTDAIAAREELEARGGEVLGDEDYLTTLAEVDDLLDAAGKSASAALRAERDADLGGAARAHAETRNSVDEILDIRADILDEWDDELADDEEFDDGYDDGEYYEEDEELVEPEVPRAAPSRGWDAEPLPAEPGEAVGVAVSSPNSPYARPPAPSQVNVADYSDEPPSVIRSEVPEGDAAGVRGGRGARLGRGISAPNERTGRAAPYRPNSGEKSSS